MNTKQLSAAFALTVWFVGAGAQLSSPIAKPATTGVKTATASAGAASAAAGLPAGSGAGVHSPNSPIAPLVERKDVVAWSVLTDIKTKSIPGT